MRSGADITSRSERQIRKGRGRIQELQEFRRFRSRHEASIGFSTLRDERPRNSCNSVSSGQPDLLVLDLLVQDFTGGGIHALHTSFASSGDPEFDRRIQEMVNDWGVRESHELIAEMIVTALRMGSDSVPVPDLKLINRSLKELRQAAKAFAPYQGIRKIAIFGSARTSPQVEVYQAAERFARQMREHGYMIITGGGDGIMGAAQRGAGRAHSFGLNIRLPFEQKANETIEGDPKLVNFNYFFTRKVNFIKETHAIALFPGGFGTMDEGFECLTLMQTGKARIIPVILIDKIGGTYWKSWTEFLRTHLLGQGLISPGRFQPLLPSPRMWMMRSTWSSSSTGTSIPTDGSGRSSSFDCIAS